MPIFYQPEIINGIHHLNEEESRHCSRVLRCRSGDTVEVMDGTGGVYRVVLTNVSGKKCCFDIRTSERIPARPSRTHLAIVPTKNTDRTEWLIEKLCEMGVDEVTFMLTKHAERKKLRSDRLERKTVSALKQSGNPYKTVLNHLTSFNDVLQHASEPQRLIAHVDDRHLPLSEVAKTQTDTLLLIGPEGDFSKEELDVATRNGCIPVGLGNNTLRTETAGLVACGYLHLMNKY